MNTLAEQTPAEIDTVLADLWRREQDALRSAAQMRRTLRTPNRLAYRVAEDQALLERYEAAAAAVRAEATPYEAEYARRPWRRYFLVTNTGGHVHRGMNCSTCFPTTEYAWLPELSGCDESVMVEEFGEKACTVCFPDAPALPAFHAPGRRDAAARAERDAEKAAKAAEKAAKAIADVDGSPLRVAGNVLRTKVAARNALSQAAQDYAWYGPTHPSDFASQIAKLVPALEAAGIETAPVIERATRKAAGEGAPHRFTA